MLFSVSDRVSGPKLSEQDRFDTAYPYRLELMLGEETSGPAGRYRLSPAETDVRARAWAEALAGRVWHVRSGRTRNARGKPGAAHDRLVTDLTEYDLIPAYVRRHSRDELLDRVEALLRFLQPHADYRTMGEFANTLS